MNNQEALRIAPPPETSKIIENSREGLYKIIKLKYNSDMEYHNKKAFTLSEVLITLGIIGVVAALTLPTLVSKFRKEVLKNQFKKSVSVMSQAILIAKANTGIDNFTEFCTYYTGTNGQGGVYENGLFCADKLREATISIGKNEQPWDSSSIKYSVDRHNENIRTYNNKQKVTYDAMLAAGYGVFYGNAIPDGSFINYHVTESQLKATVDVNGKKGPNKLGHDIFLFQYARSNDKLTYIAKPVDYPEDEIENERQGFPCSITSNQKGNGMGCSYYALRDECPYDSSKKYFECLP